MKTYYLDKPGSLDNLAMRETPTPTPGPREVLMRVHATSLNYRDLGLALGTYKSPSMPLPLVPMSDGAGEIVAVGNGVTRVKVGDRVLFGKYSGSTVKVDGDELLVMREEDIMGVIA